MSQLSRGIFGAIAVSLTFGVVQLASGHDLAEGVQSPVGTPDAAINRAAKADRAAAIATGSPAQTRTISIRLNDLSDSSVVVRVPVAQEARNAPNRPSAPAFTKSGDRKVTVACEPVVSVLTEIARLLQPGRCVT
jgi:hypothetical protein